MSDQLVLVFDKGFFGETHKGSRRTHGERGKNFQVLLKPENVAKRKATMLAIRNKRTMDTAMAVKNLTAMANANGLPFTVKEAAIALNALGFRNGMGRPWNQATLSALCVRAIVLAEGKSAA